VNCFVIAELESIFCDRIQLFQELYLIINSLSVLNMMHLLLFVLE
jgi:hypothetical protein